MSQEFAYLYIHGSFLFTRTIYPRHPLCGETERWVSVGEKKLLPEDTCHRFGAVDLLPPLLLEKLV